MTTLLTQQYSFAFNNLVYGGTGSPYQILSVDGLEGVPGIRNQDDNRGYADGMFTGRDFYAGRTISMIIQVLGDGQNSAQYNLNILQRNLLPQTQGTTPLYFLLGYGEQEQVINARVRGFKAQVNPEYTYGKIIAQVDFFCPNPVYYNINEQTALLAYTPPVGRIYDRVYNLVYTGATNIITTTVNNTGWANTYPIITLNGPINNPVLGNLTQGFSLNFSGNYLESDIIVVDLYNKLVTLNGNPARNILTSGQWFWAPPGESQFYLTGDVGSTEVNVTKAVVTWQSAYI
jgi:Phage tail protein